MHSRWARGRQFSKKFALLAQFDYDKFGVSSGTLNTQYGDLPGSDRALRIRRRHGGCGTDIGANNHIWSFTLDPTYHLYRRREVRSVCSGRRGFLPQGNELHDAVQPGCYYDYFGDCYPVTENSDL